MPRYESLQRQGFLNLVFADMAHLYQFFVINECRYLIFGQASMVFCLTHGNPRVRDS